MIAATNRDLPPDGGAPASSARISTTGCNVFPVALPPLRERADDIPPLVHSFLRRFARQAGKRIDDVSPEAMWRLLAYKWPGNVRELQNVIERAVVFARHNVLDVDALPDLSASPSPLSVAAPRSRPTPRRRGPSPRWSAGTSSRC